MAMMIGAMGRKRWRLFVGCGVLALIASATAAYGQQFVLKDGDTVLFYGDSITAQRLYTKQVEEFVLTRYPSLHIRFVNAGVPGDTVQGGYAGTMAERVQRDVAPFQPAMITVMLGMNDGGWGQGSPQIDAAFQAGYRALLDALHKAAPGAALTLICPTPYDEITHGTEFPGYSRVIDKFAGDISAMGAELQAPGDRTVLLADFHRPLTDALERAKTQFPELAPLIVPDRIHPAETGHWIMAASLMSAWHVNPAVSRLELNAASAAVIRKDHTTATNLRESADGIEWTQLDDALPLPLDLNNAMTPMLLQVSDIAQSDQMILRIESLKAGQYELSIDAKPVASFSSEELQQGINLALYKTPMLDQARGIDWTEDRRATLDKARFILSAETKASSTSAIAEATLQQAQDEMATAARKDIAPKPHHFELRRQ
ncbi:MAG: SGNH/GDSL hydrolase family protein [Terracidiphilus sp.]